MPHLGQVGLPWSRQHISIKVLASVGVPSFIRPQEPDQATAADIFFVGIIHHRQEEIVFRFQRQDVVHMGIQPLGEFRRVVWRAVCSAQSPRCRDRSPHDQVFQVHFQNREGEVACERETNPHRQQTTLL